VLIALVVQAGTFDKKVTFEIIKINALGAENISGEETQIEQGNIMMLILGHNNNPIPPIYYRPYRGKKLPLAEELKVIFLVKSSSPRT